MWAERISASRSRGCSLPPLHRLKSHQTAPLNSAHLQFHPAPVKSLHTRSNLKFLCILTPAVFNRSLMPGTHCLAWRTWSGFVAWLLQKNIRFTSVVAGPRLRCGWTAPDTRIFRRQCGCSNLLTFIGTERKTNTRQTRSATRLPHSLYPIKISQQHQLSIHNLI